MEQQMEWEEGAVEENISCRRYPVTGEPSGSRRGAYYIEEIISADS